MSEPGFIELWDYRDLGVFFCLAHNPDKPEPKRTGLSEKLQTTNSFSVAVITTAKDEPKLHATLRSSLAT
jgi:hypothetical protein